uniref:Uncharacterized protein n=1 Tax=Alexandrium monilatum TaxID=311494 RepID=A0A7S4W8Y4_9DINO
MSSLGSVSPGDTIALQPLSPSGLHTPTSQTGTTDLLWQRPTSLWDTSSLDGRSEQGDRSILPALSTAIVLLNQRFEQERREHLQAIITLQRDLQAQQRTLAEITQLLASGGLEAALRGLRQDITKQQELQDVQAGALREGLLEMRDMREEGKQRTTELAELRERLSQLADLDRNPVASLKHRQTCTAVEASRNMTEELETKLLSYCEKQFNDLMAAMDLERSIRNREVTELYTLLEANVKPVQGPSSLEKPPASRGAIWQVFKCLTCRSATPAAPTPTCCGSALRRSRQRRPTSRDAAVVDDPTAGLKPRPGKA